MEEKITVTKKDYKDFSLIYITKGNSWSVILHEEQCNIIGDILEERYTKKMPFEDDQGHKFEVSLCPELNHGDPKDDILLFTGHHDFLVTRDQIEKYVNAINFVPMPNWACRVQKPEKVGKVETIIYSGMSREKVEKMVEDYDCKCNDKSEEDFVGVAWKSFEDAHKMVEIIHYREIGVVHLRLWSMRKDFVTLSN